MALYFKDIEITNIDNLVPQTGLDITDIWFGSTNVYTIWQVYEGTLPAAINANGSDLRQYQVWGNTGGVGDKTVNLFEIESDMLSSSSWDENPMYSDYVFFINYKLSDAVTQELKKGIHTCSIFEHFTDGYTPRLLVCAFTPTITATVDEKYRILTNNGITFNRTFDFSEWQDIYLIIGYGSGFITETIKQVKINELFTNWKISIVEGSTAPASFVPFGYEVDTGVKSGNLFDTNRQRNDTFVLDSTKYIVGAIANGAFTRPEEITEFTYNNDSFTILSTSGVGIGFLVEVKPNTTYTVSYQLDVTVSNERSSAAINLITSTGNFGQYWAVYGKSRESTFTTKDDTAYVYVVFRAVDLRATYSNIMLNEGSNALPYQPYSNTTTPVYIGNETLKKDEYVDFGEQKVYRRTVNIFDAEISIGNISNVNGADDDTTNVRLRSGFLSTALSAGVYTINASGIDEVVIYKYDTEKKFIGIETSPSYWGALPRAFTLSSVMFVRFVFRHFDNRRCYVSDISNIMLTSGTTLPETYIPYYQPTDPPVPLPALPTCDGVTVIEYAGQSTAPEKVLLKYRKEGF